MKHVYLIRHGLPDFPDGKRMCIGTTDISIGETGRIQAAEMAKALPPVAAVFASPLNRAVQTAEAIGKPITILEGLREMHAGEWDGLTFDEIRERYPALYTARGNDQSIPLPGAEDKNEALARFVLAMETVARMSPGDFAVVAHGGVISLFYQYISGVMYKPDYTEIIPLFWDNGIFSLQEDS